MISVLNLALGVAANAAVFVVVFAVAIKPLPYTKPDQLAELRLVDSKSGRVTSGMPMETALAWRERARGLTTLAIHSRRSLVRTDGPEPLQVTASVIDENILRVLGAAPLLGRPFVENDSARGEDSVVLLSHRVWQEWFGADQGVIGRRLVLDRTPFTILGVMPRHFNFPRAGTADIWLPLREDGTVVGEPVSFAEVLLRLEDSSALERTEARLTSLRANLDDSESRIRLVSHAPRRASDEARLGLSIVMGAVVVMLFLVVFNFINLLLMRNIARLREIAIRQALGGSRWNVGQLVLSESVLIGLIGALVAIIATSLLLPLLLSVLPEAMFFYAVHDFLLGPNVIAYALLLGTLVGFVCGMTSLLTNVPGKSLSITLRGHGVSTRHRRTRRMLVLAEISIAVALVTTAAVQIGGFRRLLNIDPGFDVPNLTYLFLSLTSERYASSHERESLFLGLKDRVRGLPGVTDVSLSRGIPPFGSFYTNLVLETGTGGLVDDAYSKRVYYAHVEPNFFEVLGVRIVDGRGFDRGEGDAGSVAIIDTDMARYMWGSVSPVGKSFRLKPTLPWTRVVGVVDELMLAGRDDRSGAFDVFYPLPRNPDYSSMFLAIRSRVPPESVIPAVREIVRTLDPLQPIAMLQSAEEALVDSLDTPRFLAALMTFLGGVGLLVALTGIYGVVSFDIGMRSKELAIRSALGATTGDLRKSILGESLRLVFVGTLLGSVLALLISGSLQSLLAHVERLDSVALVIAWLVVIATSSAAILIPTIGKVGNDPLAAIRLD